MISQHKDELSEEYREDKPKRKKPGTLKKKVQPLHMDDQSMFFASYAYTCVYV